MNELLEKYWSGTTTIEEENTLRDYFKSDAVAPDHEVYSSMFGSFEQELLQEQVSFNAFKKLPEDFPETNKSTWKSLKGIAVAASVAVVLALGTAYFSTSNEADLGTYEDPKEAYHATMNALQMVGANFNHGKSKMKPLKEFEAKKNKVFSITN